MAAPAKYGSLPFQEQIAFFRQKVNLPTAGWTDLWEGQHARAFVVAGAAREDLLSDLRATVDKAIAQGTTLETFRKDFDKVVARTGWAYNGGRNWRTRTIYDNNVRTSYQAGRYQQMQAVKAVRPYWRYRHNDAVQHPRPEHKSWDGRILHADDPWWATHYPPNDWGCQCTVETLSEPNLKALGKDGPDEAPPVKFREVTVGARSATPRTVQVPEGIGPGWGYNVGEAAWGRRVAQATLDSERGGSWTLLPGKQASDFGRPARVPVDASRASLAPEARSPGEVYERLQAAIGGEQAFIKDPVGQMILVDRAVADHLVESTKRIDGRERYFPFIREVIEDPFEVWASFAVNDLTGKVGLRRRYVKRLRIGDAKDSDLVLVAEAVGAVWTGVTFFRGSRSLANARHGLLLWGRK